MPIRRIDILTLCLCLIVSFSSCGVLFNKTPEDTSKETPTGTDSPASSMQPGSPAAGTSANIELATGLQIVWVKKPQYEFDNIKWIGSYSAILPCVPQKGIKAYTGFIAEENNKFGIIDLNAEIIKEIKFKEIGCPHCVALNIIDNFKNLSNDSISLAGDIGHGGVLDYLVYDKDTKQFFYLEYEPIPLSSEEYTSLFNGDELIMFEYGTVKKTEYQYELTEEGSTYGFADKSGKIVIDAKYPSANIFYEGFAAVKDSTGKWGFIDANGNNITEIKYDYVGNFNEGYAVVCANDKWGYVETKGIEIIKPQFQGATEVINGQCYIKENGLWGIAKIAGGKYY